MKTEDSQIVAAPLDVSVIDLIQKNATSFAPDEPSENFDSAVKLTNVSFVFTTIGDSLDGDSILDMYLYLPPDIPNGTVASAVCAGGSAQGPGPTFSLHVAKTVTRDQLRGAHAFIQIRPDGRDKFDYRLEIYARFSDDTLNSWGPITHRIGNHDGYPSYNVYPNVF